MKRLLVAIVALAAIAGMYAVLTILYAYRSAATTVRAYSAAHPARIHAGAIPAVFLEDLLRVQDPNFCSHHGVDTARVTTITQSLMKFLYFERFEPGVEKIHQSLLAIGFDATVEKPVQLDLFLNNSYLGTVAGKDIRGFDNASRVYFGRELSALDRRDFLALVAMLRAPNDYSVRTHPAKNAARVLELENEIAGMSRAVDLCP